MSESNNKDIVDNFDLVGINDGLQRLWTPHRLAYIATAGSKKLPEQLCPFCEVPKLSDPDGLIVHRGNSCFVVLNLYPYNAGHLLISPYRHIANYHELENREIFEIAETTKTAILVLKDVYSPDGFNLGMNQGLAGGAGVADHAHQHIVPRWGGDSNFMPIIAQTKSISQLHSQVREQLSKAWKIRLENNESAI